MNKIKMINEILKRRAEIDDLQEKIDQLDGEIFTILTKGLMYYPLQHKVSLRGKNK